MKPINDLINKDPQQLVGSPQHQTSEKQRLRRDSVNLRLWKRLGEIYGHQLEAQYGEQMPKSWEDLLREITPEQIRDGLNRLAERSDKWPPNAVEFRQLCLPPTISPDGKNSEAYMPLDDPRRARNDPNSAEYVKPIPEGTLGIEYVSRRKKVARGALDNLKGMFK